MLVLLSPAKTLDFETGHAVPKVTQPVFLEESEKLVTVMRKKSRKDLMELMEISEDLAKLNVERFKDWSKEAHTKNGEARPALFVFRGDVYQGLAAEDLSEDDLLWAQDHLRILSGLYGVLKPLDGILPYRLEMGRPVATRAGKNLYEFWDAKITEELNSANGTEESAVINLASNEYFSSVQKKKLTGEVISPVFQDQKGDKWMVMSFFAKRARGMMARWIIENRVTDPAELTEFKASGYRYLKSESSAGKPVFRRKEADRPGPGSN